MLNKNLNTERERIRPELDQAAEDIKAVLHEHFRRITEALDLGRPLTAVERAMVSSWLRRAIEAA